MGIVTLIVLIGLGYWLIKIPLEITKFILSICWFLLWKFVYLIKYG